MEWTCVMARIGGYDSKYRNMSRYCTQGYIVSYDFFVSQLLRLEWKSRIAEDHCHLVDGFN